MLVTESGMVTLSKDVLFLNAYLLMTVTKSGTMKLSSLDK